MRRRCYEHIHKGGHTSSIWMPTSLLKPWRYFQIQKHFQYAVDEDDKDYLYETYHTVRFLHSYLWNDLKWAVWVFRQVLPGGSISPVLRARYGSQLGAIAFGSSTAGQPVAQNPSFNSPSVSGSNTYGVLFMYRGAADATVSTATWNSVSMAAIDNNTAASSMGADWGIAAPAAGVNTVVFNSSASKTYRYWCGYYTGVNQNNTPDNHNTTDYTAATSTTHSIVPSADNCWAVAQFGQNPSADTSDVASTGLTDRGAFDGTTVNGDSNAAIHPAASYSMTVTGNSRARRVFAITLAPAGAATSNSHRLTMIGVGS